MGHSALLLYIQYAVFTKQEKRFFVVRSENDTQKKVRREKLNLYSNMYKWSFWYKYTEKHVKGISQRKILIIEIVLVCNKSFGYVRIVVICFHLTFSPCLAYILEKTFNFSRTVHASASKSCYSNTHSSWKYTWTSKRLLPDLDGVYCQPSRC